MDIRDNHFELFGLPISFAIDGAALDTAYRELQNRVHPDKFATGSDVEKRVALQWAARANEAYRSLRDPAKRAAYLCELGGADLHARSNSPMSPEFLVQQMEWRESLEEAEAAGDTAALERLDSDGKEARSVLLDRIEQLLDRHNDIEQASQCVRQLMFLEKFAEEVGDAFESIEA